MMQTGLDQLLDRGLPPDRVGVLTHPSGVTADLRHGVDALIAAGADVVAVYGAEHGFRGTAQAGASEPSSTDPATGARVFDTYGAGPAALRDMLGGIDVLLVDLQGVGARFYTYESTLYDVIGATVGGGPRVIVLDRPNPIGGSTVAGPMLDPAYASFVGRAPLPVRHGLTMGELALLFADLHGAPPVEVVELAGWRRADYYPATGRPWVPPSPNIPTAATTVCYPGTCLLEGTSLAPGRGTTTPFQVCGAPYADGRLADALRSARLPGVLIRETQFVPTFSDYAGEPVTGVALHVTDPVAYQPMTTAVTLLAAAHRIWPAEMTFCESHLDRLAGGPALRLAICAGAEPTQIVAEWTEDVEDFRRRRAPYLLYS